MTRRQRRRRLPRSVSRVGSSRMMIRSSAFRRTTEGERGCPLASSLLLLVLLLLLARLRDGDGHSKVPSSGEEGHGTFESRGGRMSRE